MTRDSALLKQFLNAAEPLEFHTATAVCTACRMFSFSSVLFCMAAIALCKRTVLYFAFNLLLQSWGKKYHWRIREEPVSAGCAGHLPVKSSTYMLTAPHSYIKCLVFKLLLYWQREVLLFFKHLGFANFSVISSFNFTVPLTLQQSSVVNQSLNLYPPAWVSPSVVKVLIGISE